MPELSANPSECLAERVLDAWAAGDLSAQEQQRCEAHLAQCSACRARKQANTTHHADLQVAVKPKAARTYSWLTLPLLAACAALAFVVLRQPAVPRETLSTGAPRIGYFVKRGDTVTRGQRTTAVHPRDALRFVYSADRAYHLAIFSADARGVGVYFPSTHAAQPISAGRDVALDFSLELDETLGRERVTALFCDDPFEIEPVQSALSSGSPLPASLASCERAALDLNKQAP